MYKEDRTETKAIISDLKLYNMINDTNRRLKILCAVDSFRMRRETYIDNINQLQKVGLIFTDTLNMNYHGVDMMNRCINRMLKRLEKL